VGQELKSGPAVAEDINAQDDGHSAEGDSRTASLGPGYGTDPPGASLP